MDRKVTHVAQNTRFTEEIMVDFRSYVNQRIIENSISSNFIVNIDETNINFDLCGGTTLERRGSRTVNAKKSGSSQRATVILGVTLSGEKLPPFIVFKGKVSGRIARSFSDNFPMGLKYDVQDNAWVDERVFLNWAEKVWSPFCDKTEKNTYLIMDEYRVHLMGSCLNKIQEKGTEIDFIPSGYTSQLQVLDVGINKPFKNYMRMNMNNL